MSMSRKIKELLLEQNLSIEELGGKLDVNMFNKLSIDNFSVKELKLIANALNCSYDGVFTFRDTGKKI